MSYADQVFISMCEDYERDISRQQSMNYYGSGRKNQIMIMILRVTYGMNGQMKTVPLEKLMDTRWESNINTKRECWIR